MSEQKPHMEGLQQFPDTYAVNEKSLVWHFPKHLPIIGGFTLYGNSWACHQTAFQIPELGWTLDVGFIPHPQRRTHVFVTHAHGDHSSSMPYLISRHCPPTVFLPEVTVESCRGYLESHLDFRLHGQDIGERLPSYHLKGVQGGQKLKLEGKVHNDKIIEVYDVDHSVSCVGYGFSQEKKRLKPEYTGLPGKELGLLRKNGTIIDQFYESPIFAFMGDTTAEFYQQQSELEKLQKENIFRFPLIITECTFLGLDNDDEARATKTKHTFWPDLKPFVESHQNVIFVLIHFSKRYSSTEVRNFFEKETLSNIVAFVESEHMTVLQSSEGEHDDDQ